MLRRFRISGSGLRRLAAAVLVLAATGCGKPTGNISGKVLYQDKPLPGGYVNFMGQGSDSTVKASAIEKDGSYSITGMPVGEAKITVQGIFAPLQPTQGGLPPAAAGSSSQAANRPTVYVPPEYGNAEMSKLTYTVVSGAQTHNIELK